MSLASMNTKDTILLTVDGKPTTHFSWPINGTQADFEFSPDGVLSFVALSDGNIRLFHVTPSADASVATLLATAKDPKPQ